MSGSVLPLTTSAAGSVWCAATECMDLWLLLVGLMGMVGGSGRCSRRAPGATDPSGAMKECCDSICLGWCWPSSVRVVSRTVRTPRAA